MAFNYRQEKLKFDRQWARLREQYEAEGMSPKDIDEMYEFDCAWFRSRRRFDNHTQELPAEQIDGEEENSSSLFNKFESMRTVFDESAFEARFAWVDTIEEEFLADKLRQLYEADLELLTLIAFDGYKQPQIAELLDCSQSNISQKITRLKKYLRKS